jgi:hypothetical protein
MCRSLDIVLLEAAQADHTFQPEELEAYTTLSNHPTVSKFTPKLLGYKARINARLGFALAFAQRSFRVAWLGEMGECAALWISFIIIKNDILENLVRPGTFTRVLRAR